ncbi:hypothetical protein ABE452_25410 [Paenibacillus ferrarius]
MNSPACMRSKPSPANRRSNGWNPIRYVLILDLMMDDRDGFEVLRYLNKNPDRVMTKLEIYQQVWQRPSPRNS